MGSLFSSGKSSKGNSNNNNNNNGNNSSRPSRKEEEITSKDRAILDLKNSKDRLKKFKKKLEAESDKLTNQAKAHIRQQQKERALLLLKLKKMKEKEVEKIDHQLLSVMEMIDNIEWEYTNMQVLKALKEGNNALNKLHDEMSYEDVVALLDETNEAIEVENQINQLLAGQLNTEDDEELQKELAELMGESVPAAASKSPAASNKLDLPDAPTHEIKVQPAPAPEQEKETRKAAVAV